MILIYIRIIHSTTQFSDP